VILSSQRRGGGGRRLSPGEGRDGKNFFSLSVKESGIILSRPAGKEGRGGEERRVPYRFSGS